MDEREFFRNAYSDRSGCSGPLYLACLVVVCLMLFTGCKTVYVPVKEVHTEYVTKTDTFFQKDSLVLHDSVYIHSKGDTVWYEKWHTKYIDRWKEIIRTDTLIRTDSIPQPYPVPAKLTVWEKAKVDFGGYAIFIAIGFILFSIYMVLRRLRR